jgi:hypothetical protein
MNQLRQVSLFTAIILWATLVGAIVYSHVVFLSAYLHHLPESTSLTKGPYGIHDERFWMFIHPALILSLVLTTLLNWKVKERRKYILVATGVYISVLAVTVSYFVPELMAFAESANSGLPKTEWLQRGQQWERLSWIRGAVMYSGFVFLLIALGKKRVQVMVAPLEYKKQTKMERA